MGGDIDSLVQMMKKMNSAGGSNKQVLGTDFKEMLNIFTELSKVKKQR